MKGLPSKDVNARDNEAGIIIGEQMQGKKQYTFRSLFHTYEPLIAGAFYCLMSMSMILTNKHVLSNFNYSCTNSILLLQNVMSVLFVLGGNLMGILQTEQMRLDIVKIWLPVNIIFVGMIWTGFFSLKNLGVGMVTILKNFTNVIVIFGDKFFFGKNHSGGVWFTIGLLFASVICGASTDIAFNVAGYTWQLLNCFFTAGYSLTLRGVMERAKTLLQNSKGLDEFSMVLYNNVLSIPFVLLLMVRAGEIPKFYYELQEQSAVFYLAALFSGVVGFGISTSVLWFLSKTSATTFNITGSLNKIPTVVFGFFFFSTETNFWNILSIAFGLGAGIMFTWAKLRESQKPKLVEQDLGKQPDSK